MVRSFRMTRVYSAIGRDVVIGNVIWEKGFLPFRAKARNTGENFKLTESGSKKFQTSSGGGTLMSAASIRVEREFAAFANQIAEVERNDFFDSRNRKTWMREFGLYLQRKAEETKAVR